MSISAANDEEISIRVSSHIRRVVRGGAAVFEKQYVTDYWTGTDDVIRRRAEREYQLLQDMQNSRLFHGRLGLLRVASCDPQQATITTHEVRGRPLGAWLRDPLPARPLLPWYLAGVWLRAFQQLPVTAYALDQFTDKDPAGLVEYCDVRLRSIHEHGYRWPDAHTHQRLLAVLQRLEDRTPEWERKTVWVHADYAPGNLIWDGRVLTPIDFATARTGGPLDDASYLIHRLQMQRIYRPWLRLPVAAYSRAILRGLGLPDAADSPGFRGLMIRRLVCRLHTYVLRPPSHLRQSIHDRWVRANVRRRLLAAVARDETLDQPRNQVGTSLSVSSSGGR